MLKEHLDSFCCGRLEVPQSLLVATENIFSLDVCYPFDIHRRIKKVAKNDGEGKTRKAKFGDKERDHCWREAKMPHLA